MLYENKTSNFPIALHICNEGYAMIFRNCEQVFEYT